MNAEMAMNVINSLGNFVSNALDFNKATLSGALDVIAVTHDDGSVHCTPFHVRFGKLKLLRSRDKIVHISVNGRRTDLFMRLGDAGEAYFLHAKPGIEPVVPSVPARGTPSSGRQSSSGARSHVLPVRQEQGPLPQLHEDGSVTIGGVRVSSVKEWDDSHTHGHKAQSVQGARPPAAVEPEPSSPLSSSPIEHTSRASPGSSEDVDRAGADARAAVELVAAAAALEARAAGTDPLAAAEEAVRVVTQAQVQARERFQLVSRAKGEGGTPSDRSRRPEYGSWTDRFGGDHEAETAASHLARAYSLSDSEAAPRGLHGHTKVHGTGKKRKGESGEKLKQPRPRVGLTTAWSGPDRKAVLENSFGSISDGEGAEEDRPRTHAHVRPPLPPLHYARAPAHAHAHVSSRMLQEDREHGLPGMRPGELAEFDASGPLEAGLGLERDAVTAGDAAVATLNRECDAAPGEAEEMLRALALEQLEEQEKNGKEGALDELSRDRPLSATDRAVDATDNALATIGGAVVKAAAEMAQMGITRDSAAHAAVHKMLDAHKEPRRDQEAAAAPALAPASAGSEHARAVVRRRRQGRSSKSVFGTVLGYITGEGRYEYDFSDSSGGEEEEAKDVERDQDKIARSVSALVGGRRPGQVQGVESGPIRRLPGSEYAFDIDTLGAQTGSRNAKGGGGAARGGARKGKGAAGAGVGRSRRLSTGVAAPPFPVASSPSSSPTLVGEGQGLGPALWSSRTTQQEAGVALGVGPGEPRSPMAREGVVVPPWHVSKRYTSVGSIGEYFAGTGAPHTPFSSEGGATTTTTTPTPVCAGADAPTSPARLHHGPQPLHTPTHLERLSLGQGQGQVARPLPRPTQPELEAHAPGTGPSRRWLSGFFSRSDHTQLPDPTPVQGEGTRDRLLHPGHSSASALPSVLLPNAMDFTGISLSTGASVRGSMQGSRPRRNWFESDVPSLQAAGEEQQAVPAGCSREPHWYTGPSFTAALSRALLPHLHTAAYMRSPAHAVGNTHAQARVPGQLSREPYVARRTSKAGFLTVAPTGAVAPLCTSLPRELEAAARLRGGGLLEQAEWPRHTVQAHGKQTTTKGRPALHGMRRERTVSFDLSALTLSQRDTCHAAFAGWIDSLADKAIELQGTAKDGIDIDVPLVSTSLVQTPAPVERRISKRERFLGWIPLLGPMVIPRTESLPLPLPTPSLNGAASAASLQPPFPAFTHPSLTPSAGSHAHVYGSGTEGGVLMQKQRTTSLGTAPTVAVQPDECNRHGRHATHAGAGTLTSPAGVGVIVDDVSTGVTRMSGSALTSPLTSCDDTASLPGSFLQYESEEGDGAGTGAVFEDDNHAGIAGRRGAPLGVETARYTRSLLPLSNELVSLQLDPGPNTLTFEVEGVTVSSSLFLWDTRARIIVSDVDGTITKSDVLGHIFFYVGRDWTHTGVAQLYSNVRSHGYHFVYLTSRAIGQTEATKTYLTNVRQFAADEKSAKNPAAPSLASASDMSAPSPSSTPKPVTSGLGGPAVSPASALANAPPSFVSLTTGKVPDGVNVNVYGSGVAGVAYAGASAAAFGLPPGPVITSPDRLLTAFTREVILRKPQEFKIAALRDIQRLFPPGVNPFYAGFGNRDTDVVSYRAVGIPEGKIFVIDPSGDVRQVNNTYCKNYQGINSLVQEMFPLTASVSIEAPGVGARYGTPVQVDGVYTDAYYWRKHLPSLSTLEEEEREAGRAEAGEKKREKAAMAVAVATPAKEAVHVVPSDERTRTVTSSSSIKGVDSTREGSSVKAGKPVSGGPAGAALDPLQESMRAALARLDLAGLSKAASVPAAKVGVTPSVHALEGTSAGRKA